MSTDEFDDPAELTLEAPVEPKQNGPPSVPPPDADATTPSAPVAPAVQEIIPSAPLGDTASVAVVAPSPATPQPEDTAVVDAGVVGEEKAPHEDVDDEEAMFRTAVDATAVAAARPAVVPATPMATPSARSSAPPLMAQPAPPAAPLHATMQPATPVIVSFDNPDPVTGAVGTAAPRTTFAPEYRLEVIGNIRHRDVRVGATRNLTVRVWSRAQKVAEGVDVFFTAEMEDRVMFGNALETDETVRSGPDGKATVPITILDGARGKRPFVVRAAIPGSDIVEFHIVVQKEVKL